MPALLCLPDEVLRSILTQVPLKDRLGSCCLVHTRLRTAAVAATQCVELGRQYRPLLPEGAQSAESWLCLYGQHVTRLQAWYPQTWPLQSCPNLLDLRLYGGWGQLAPTADGCRGVVQGITKLTRLELHSAIVAGGPFVDGLSSLVHLKHLHTTAGLPAATLPCLRHLTHLRVDKLSLETLQQLAALTALQELHCMGAVEAAVSPSSVTGLALPPSLTQLAIKGQLEAEGERGAELVLLPMAPTGLRVLRVDSCAGPALPRPLLPCIARLQCLTQLDLFAWSAVDWPRPSPVYSALTASSSLVSLRVAGNLPAGVWPFVFGAGQQLPHLTCLSFDDEGACQPELWAFGAADLAALTSCCPALCEIYYLWLQHGPHVSELRKLTALTRLDVCCGDGDPGGVVQGLAAVTQIDTLFAHLGTPAVPLSVASLLPLTSLTALNFICCSWSDEDEHEHVFDTEAGAPPDVWLQLLEGCAAIDPACQPTALRSMAQQLAAQRALTAPQAEQISGLQAQLADQQQLAAQQGACIAGLQSQLTDQQQRNEVLQQQHAAVQQQHREQLSAQQQAAAQQGARIAALEGQLEQLLQRLP